MSLNRKRELWSGPLWLNVDEGNEFAESYKNKETRLSDPADDMLHTTKATL